GAPGPKGDTGATGPAGADGKDGAPGPKGDTGATGPAGADGKDGAPGPAGEDGKNGLDGKDGFIPAIRLIPSTTIHPVQDPGASANIKGFVIKYSDEYAEVHFDFGVTLNNVQTGALDFPLDWLPEIEMLDHDQPYNVSYLDQTKTYPGARVDLKGLTNVLSLNLTLSGIPNNANKTIGIYNMVCPLYKRGGV
ncbi:hypothetical protein ACXYVY_05585, partial [Lactococcus garvieae]